MLHRAALALGAFLSLGAASLAADVGTTPLTNPTGGFDVIDISIPTDPTWFFTSKPGNQNGSYWVDPPGGGAPVLLNWSYDYTTKALDIGNIKVDGAIKYLLLTVNWDSSSGYFQPSGKPFDPAQWPTLTAAGDVTPTGGSNFSGGDSGPWISYFQATIYPQPASETISFANIPNDSLQHISSFSVDTICEAPEIPTWGMMLIGFAAFGVVRACGFGKTKALPA
jgi:hypothetical protein